MSTSISNDANQDQDQDHIQHNVEEKGKRERDEEDADIEHENEKKRARNNGDGGRRESVESVDDADLDHAKTNEEDQNATDPKPVPVTDEEEELDEEEFTILVGKSGENATGQSKGEGDDDDNDKIYLNDDIEGGLRFDGRTTQLKRKQEEAMKATGINVDNYVSRALEMNKTLHEKRKPNAFEIDLDNHPEKGWRRPQAIPSDYFNYGLNETTFKEYAAAQVALRAAQQLQR